MNTITKGWETLAERVMPKNAPPIQHREMRRAFFAGAALMHSMMADLGNEDISENAALALIEAWKEEIDLFAQQIEMGED